MKLLMIMIVLVTLLPTLVTAGGRGYDGPGRQAYTSVYQKQNIEQGQNQRQDQTANGGRGYGGEGGLGGGGGQGGSGGAGGLGGNSDQQQTAKAKNEGNNNYTSYKGDDYDNMYSDYVASAIAPQLVTGTCLGSASAGIQVPGWAGLSGGSTVLDVGCDAMRASLHMLYLGQQLNDRDLKRASILRLCDHEPNRKAMGPLCPPDRIKPEPVQSSMFQVWE